MLMKILFAMIGTVLAILASFLVFFLTIKVFKLKEETGEEIAAVTAIILIVSFLLLWL